MKKNTNFIIKKLLRPVPSRSMVEQAINMAASDPSEVTQETLKTPDSKVTEDHLIKGIIK